ncbi:MAG: hypothetical protein HMLKMBBP_00267 [Planctomycetes bacterium]|nr:hypothetical protein [Planctomycetota bacterium]
MKVLFLAHRVPWPADKGDRLRSASILSWLASRHEVHLAAFGDGPDAGEARRAEDALRPLCASIRVEPRPPLRRGIRALWTGRSVSEEVFSSPAMDRHIAETAARVRPDAALAYSSQMARPLLALDVPRRVADLVDVDSAKWRRRFETSRNPLWWIEARRVRALELRCLRELDAVTVVTRREAEHLGGEGGRLRVVPMNVDLRGFAARERDPGGAAVGFVGAMDYGPNAEGALWFAREVFPLVRAARPDATFVVVGRNPPEALRGLPGVDLRGRVEDIRPVMQSCAAAVVPIRTSHGVQTKAVVTMALGVPQVMTPDAFAGLDAEPGTHGLAASAPADFAAATLRLLDNPDERARIAAAARRFAEQRFDQERVLAGLGELLEGGASPAPSPGLRGAATA